MQSSLWRHLPAVFCHRDSGARESEGTNRQMVGKDRRHGAGCYGLAVSGVASRVGSRYCDFPHTTSLLDGSKSLTAPIYPAALHELIKGPS